MAAFHEEMAKVALFPEALLKHLSRAGTRRAVGAGLGSGLGLGLGAGAAIGGAHGARSAYQGAKERGDSAVGAALSAVGGGLGGAVRGAGKGAVIGAGAGALAGAALPAKALSASRGLQKLDNVAGTLNNFGQRQVHTLTGWQPGGAARSVERIGAGAAPARRELGALQKELATGLPVGKLERATKSLAAADKAQEMGLTSLPGYAKSLKNNGVLPTVAAGAKSQWDSVGGKGKAMMVGLPALSVASTLRSPAGEGPGRGERIGKVVGGTLGGVAAPLSLGGSLVLSAGLERAGGAVGKVFDKKRGRPPQRPEVPQEPSRPPASEPGDTGQHAVEHVYGTGFNGGGLE